MLEAHDILLCIADHQWTLEALHLVSALARDIGANLLLVKLVPVTHPHLLGAPFAFWHYSPEDRCQVAAYAETAQDYGVAFSLYIVQYIDFAGAVLDLADRLQPQVIVAKPPRSVVPFWCRLTLWSLRRNLGRRNVLFFTLENPLETLLWAPPVQRPPAAGRAAAAATAPVEAQPPSM